MLCKRSNGFTLVELMVVIAIVAILATLAFPSFEGSMRSNRVATTTNEMLASLSLARSEAVRNSAFSEVCASADGATCPVGGSWNDGWLVRTYADTAAGTVPVVVKVVQGHPRMAIAGTAPTIIRFDYRGRPRTADMGTITVQPDTCPSSQTLIRTLTVTRIGQVNTVKDTCA